MLTPDELRARIATYVDAVNGRDPVGIAGLFTEDGVQADPVSNPPNVGRPGHRRVLRQRDRGQRHVDLHRQSRPHLRANVAIDFEISVQTGGSTMVIDGIEVFTADADGLFTSVYAYWDDADLTFR